MQRIISVILIVILAFPILILISLATIDTQSFGLFKQRRMGLNGKGFSIFKIRTLKGKYTSSVTSSQMKKSWFGTFLRRTHLDELPQIFNIALGDMNFVGPRPDTKDMYELLSDEDFNYCV